MSKQNNSLPTNNAKPGAGTNSTMSSFQRSLSGDPSMRSSQSNRTRSSVVPVSGESDSEERRELNLQTMTYEEIKRLKSSDPFMYYSIPEMRRLSYKADESDDDADDDEEYVAPNPQSPAPVGHRDVPNRRSMSCPAEMLKSAELVRTMHARGSITRRRRLSTEGHHTVAMEDMLGELEDLDTDSDEEDERIARLLSSAALQSLPEQDESG